MIFAALASADPRDDAVDLTLGRRLHAVPLVSGVLLVVAFFEVPLYAVPVWRDVGRTLLQPFV